MVDEGRSRHVLGLWTSERCDLCCCSGGQQPTGGEADALWVPERTAKVPAGGLRQRWPQTPQLPNSLCKVWKPRKRQAHDPLPERDSAEWYTEFGAYLKQAMEQARCMAAEVRLPTELAQMPGWKAQVSSLCPSSMPPLTCTACFAICWLWGPPILFFQRAQLKRCRTQGLSLIHISEPTRPY